MGDGHDHKYETEDGHDHVDAEQGHRSQPDGHDHADASRVVANPSYADVAQSDQVIPVVEGGNMGENTSSYKMMRPVICVRARVHATLT